MRMKIMLGAAALVAIAIVLTLTLSGGDEGTTNTDVDGAFISEMVPHHESAIEMAQIAQTRAEHPEIRQLASDIIATQSDEIDQLSSANQALYGQPVGAADHGSLGLDESMMGMMMDTSALETAQPFDRAFIDMMVPHHQGAIRMAQLELQGGDDPELEQLATDIISAQTREIEAMNGWREKWYGAPSPAGGVPEPVE